MKEYTLYAQYTAQNVSGTVYNTTAETLNLQNNKIYIQFRELPAELANLSPQSVQFRVYVDATSLSGSPERDFTKGTYNTPSQKLDIPNGIYPAAVSDGTAIYWGYVILPYSVSSEDTGGVNIGEVGYAYPSHDVKDMHTLGLILNKNIYVGDSPILVYTANSDHPPYLILKYNEGNLSASAQSPSGYADRAKPITFAWDVYWDGMPLADVAQTSATLEYKDGESGTVTSISINSSAKQYVMPANTLPASQQLLWRVTVSAEGSTASTAWTRLYTQEPKPTVAALSPSDMFVYASRPNEFKWQYNIDTGTPPYGFEIRVSPVGSSASWTTIAALSMYDGTSYTIPAGTLPTGNLWWSVRAYNRDLVASEWSSALKITVIGPPAKPDISLTNSSPRPGIAWTSTEQQAYQVQMGSFDSGLVFGTDKTYRCPEYLPAGRTTLQVRVVNKYGLYSEWASVVTTIVNGSASVALTLSVVGRRDAQLSWTAVESATAYHVYRNGKRIAIVTGTAYQDRYAIGETRYFVRAVFADSSYTDSAVITHELAVDCPCITALDGDWIELRYTSDSLPAIQTTAERDVSLMQYSAATYPVPEAAPFRRRSYTVSAAFRRGDEPAFEALLGRVVCVKDQYGNLITGVMASSTRAQNVFYTTYTAVVSEVEQDI